MKVTIIKGVGMLVKIAVGLWSAVVLVQAADAVKNAGSIGVISVILTILLATLALRRELRRIWSKTWLMSVEHEMLVGDYCERKGIKPADLPTRQGHEFSGAD